MIQGANVPTDADVCARLLDLHTVLDRDARRNGGTLHPTVAAWARDIEALGRSYLKRRDFRDFRPIHAQPEAAEVPSAAPVGTMRDVMTAQDVARVLDCTPRNVCDLAARQTLLGCKRNGRWTFTRTDLEHYLTTKES